MQRRHSAGSISSTAPVGPAIPALLMSASRPPSVGLHGGEHAVDVGLVRYVGLDRAGLRIGLAEGMKRRVVDVADEHARLMGKQPLDDR